MSMLNRADEDVLRLPCASYDLVGLDGREMFSCRQMEKGGQLPLEVQ